MEPRGIRNNNPGNIEHNPINKWQGLADPPIEQNVPRPRFARFTSPEYGIRAIAVLLTAYQDRHGLDTVNKLIGRWAPSSENNTSAYARGIATTLGVDADDKINVHQYSTMRPLVEAIIRHENGKQPYTKHQIDRALFMAGIKPEVSASTAVSSVTVQGAAGSALAGFAIVADQIAGVVRETSASIDPSSMFAGILGGAVIVLSVIAIWGRMRIKQDEGA